MVFLKKHEKENKIRYEYNYEKYKRWSRNTIK